MDIYVMLWIMIQYCFLYFLTQVIVSLITGSSFSWPLCLSEMPPSLWDLLDCEFLSTFILLAQGTLSSLMYFQPWS